MCVDSCTGHMYCDAVRRERRYEFSADFQLSCLLLCPQYRVLQGRLALRTSARLIAGRCSRKPFVNPKCGHDEVRISVEQTPFRASLEIVRLGVPRLGTRRKQKQQYDEKTICPRMAFRTGLLRSSASAHQARHFAVPNSSEDQS
jgi:hypothetical protein